VALHRLKRRKRGKVAYLMGEEGVARIPTPMMILVGIIVGQNQSSQAALHYYKADNRYA
jgi:hypothetical protein